MFPAFNTFFSTWYSVFIIWDSPISCLIGGGTKQRILALLFSSLNVRYLVGEGVSYAIGPIR